MNDLQNPNEIDETTMPWWGSTIEGCRREVAAIVASGQLDADDHEDRFRTYGELHFALGRLQWLDAASSRRPKVERRATVL